MALFKNCNWAPDPSGKADIFDLRIENGVITEKSTALTALENEQVINLEGFYLSPGWVDVQARMGAPSFPERESEKSFFSAALAGGFTAVQILPEMDPVVQSIESVWYYKNLRDESGIRLLVSAAATKDLEGKKMSNLLTLKDAGADSFSTVFPISNSSFMLNLLLYLTHSGKTLFCPPWVAELAEGGQAHDGFTAENRGLEAIPSVAETIQLYRDIELVKYTQGRLHWPTISTHQGVAILRNLKKEGIESITASVAAHQLAFTDESLDQFDTLYKVNPPFRSESDRQALIAGILDGTIECVCSDHTPIHQDGKDIEFGNASFGISALQTVFPCLVHYVPGISPRRICELLSLNPRKILDLNQPEPEIGERADFTIFSLEGETQFTPKNWKSSSINSPFYGKSLKGTVLGIITSAGFQANPSCSPL